MLSNFMATDLISSLLTHRNYFGIATIWYKMESSDELDKLLAPKPYTKLTSF